MMIARAALRTQLLTVAGLLPPVAWQNRGFTPPSPPALWIKENLMPATEALSSFGSEGNNGLVREDGLYQLMVFAPAQDGTTAAETLAEVLRDTFKPGTRITATEGVIVRCQSAEIKPPMSDATWYSLPIEIRYYLFREN
jgi:hypothetical protein